MTATVIAPASSRLNNALTDFAASYRNTNFIADTVAPFVYTDKMSGSFGKRLRKDVATAMSDLVGPRTKVNEVTYSIDSGTYSCKGRGLSQAVSTELVANADAWIDAKQFATRNVMQRLFLAREIRVSALFSTSGNWASTNTAAVGTVWSDKINATPLDDLLTARRAIPGSGDDGMRIIGICSDTVWDKLSVHPQITDLWGGGNTQGGPIARKILADAIRISDIFVSDLEKNTANEGQTASYSRVWSATEFYLACVPTQVMSTEQMMFAATFRNKYPGSQNGVIAYDWTDMSEGMLGTDKVVAGFYDDEGVVQNDAGYRLSSVL